MILHCIYLMYEHLLFLIFINKINNMLRADAYHYEAGLKREGVEVEHVCATKCYHGWWSAGAIRKVDTFREHYQTLVKYMDKHL